MTPKQKEIPKHLVKVNPEAKLVLGKTYFVRSSSHRDSVIFTKYSGPDFNKWIQEERLFEEI